MSQRTFYSKAGQYCFLASEPHFFFPILSLVEAFKPWSLELHITPVMETIPKNKQLKTNILDGEAVGV